MVDDKLSLVKPCKNYFGAQGVAYGSGTSRKTAGSEKNLHEYLTYAFRGTSCASRA